MTPETVRTLSPTALQEHAGWMRGLVARLVHDSGRVDDLVQEAWAAALVNPPPAGLPLRAWLGGIVRRSVLARRRGEVRQRERETQRTFDAARAGQDVARDVAELSACADEQRALMEAITELPEGEKAVLLLRFYEGLPPREIAARLEVPVNTVRTRQRLGLERLRTLLDRRHGGDSSAWAALLLPLARIVPGRMAAAGTAAALSVPAAIARFLLFGVAVLGVVLAVRYLMGPGEPPSLARVTTPEVALAEIHLLVASPMSASPARVPLAAGPVAAPTGPVFGGKVVDLGGRRIAGARIETTFRPEKNTVYVISNRSASPAWMTTGSEGEFRGAAPSPDAIAWVRAQHPEYLQVQQAVPLRAGEPGVITMVRVATTTLEVEVVDAGSGRECWAFSAIAGQWLDSMGEGYPRQSALSASGEPSGSRLSMNMRFAVDRPLHVSLRDVTGMFGEVSREQVRQEVQPVEGGVTHVRFILELDGPEESGRFPVARGQVVDAETGEPVPHVTVAVKGELMSYTDGDPDRSEVRLRRVETGPDGAFRTAIPAGTQGARAQLFHPSYVPRGVELSLDEQAPATFEMQRRGELRGTVLDRDGRPVANAPLLLALPKMVGRSDRLRLFTDDSGAFRVPDILSGRVHVFVLRAPRDADEDALASDSFRVSSGVTRDVEIRMSRPERVHVTGQVRSGDEHFGEVVPIFLPYSERGGWSHAKATRDGFDAGGLERGTYLVALVPAEDGARGGATLLAGIEVDGFGAQRMEFTVPALELSGRMASGPNDSLPSDLRAVAIPLGVEGFAGEMLSHYKAAESFGQPVDPGTGAYRLPRLSPGAYRLELWSGSARGAGPLATQEIELSGSLRLTDWVIAP